MVTASVPAIMDSNVCYILAAPESKSSSEFTGSRSTLCTIRCHLPTLSGTFNELLSLSAYSSEDDTRVLDSLSVIGSLRTGKLVEVRGIEPRS